LRRWSENCVAEDSKYAQWIKLHLSLRLSWVLGIIGILGIGYYWYIGILGIGYYWYIGYWVLLVYWVLGIIGILVYWVLGPFVHGRLFSSV